MACGVCAIIPNITGEFQGVLRFAPLDLDLLDATVWEDLSSNSGISGPSVLAVTCLDQFGGLCWAREIEEKLCMPVAYASFGPRCGDFVEVSKLTLPDQHLISEIGVSM